MASIMKEFEHLKIHLEDIKKATNSFSSQVIGTGGFGKVYEGEVSHARGRSFVAIKRLNREYGQGDPEFMKEIVMLSRYAHKNLVSLLGYCDEDGEKILVYEHASNGSLDRHLGSTVLTWKQRLKICLDVARGLTYLHGHKGTLQRVLHRDIKSANILLDENWNAKLADMGLSKIGPANQQHTVLFTNVVGTPGYCDPQYMVTYALTKESDIYSFGVVLFEVLCGRLCFKWTNDQLEVLVPMWKHSYLHKKLDKIIFKDLIPLMDPTSLRTFSDIAFQCLHDSREQRPTMSLLVKKLHTALKFQERHEMKLDDAKKTSHTCLNTLFSKGKGIFLGKKVQQWFSPSPYNNTTGGGHLEQNYAVSKFTPENNNRETTSLMLNGQMSQPIDNDDYRTKFESRLVSQNVDRAYDYYGVNNRFQDRTDANNFQPQSNDGEDSYALDGPGIENFQIIGDAKLGGKLLGCGFPVRGTSLCMFQWARHLQDGTKEYIEGAVNPEYVVAVDDVDKLIAAECIPIDDQGRQGQIVRLFANKQNKISCDSEMQQEIDIYMSAGQASFSVFLQMEPSKKQEDNFFFETIRLPDKDPPHTRDFYR